LSDQKSNGRTLFIGVGNELHGDDSAGLQAIKLVKRSGIKNPGIQTLIAGNNPESLTGVIRSMAPDIVIFVDAAQMNLPPGSITLFLPAEISGLRTSTHTLPLDIICTYLAGEVGCTTFVLGIQPENNQILQPISQQACAAARKIAAFISTL
jgi:hydrogenase 3 maturation protease